MDKALRACIEYDVEDEVVAAVERMAESRVLGTVWNPVRENLEEVRERVVITLLSSMDEDT